MCFPKFVNSWSQIAATALNITSLNIWGFKAGKKRMKELSFYQKGECFPDVPQLTSSCIGGPHGHLRGQVTEKMSFQNYHNWLRPIVIKLLKLGIWSAQTKPKMY